ncbi:hypothetical protein BDF22DRAFT_658110 [Syncephalis plumigaleata]|nr:hypothetical protein BDF22DRAFT_658110 [Syncephalis plumigaleata]
MFGAHSYMLADPSQKLTMFAPTNTAFDRLSPNARRLLLPNDYLNRLFMGFTLAAHLVPTTIPPESIWTNQQYDVPTLAGVSLHITRPSHSNNSNNNTRQGHIRVEDANIIGDPIVTQNGIVYPIDQLADPLADLDLSINDVSEKMVDDLFHFSDSFKQRSNNTS